MTIAFCDMCVPNPNRLFIHRTDVCVTFLQKPQIDSEAGISECPEAGMNLEGGKMKVLGGLLNILKLATFMFMFLN